MISVIVTTFNRCEILARCLQTLAEQDYPASDYEIIVVVDGSTDGTLDLLDTLQFRPTLRVVKQPNKGLAAARNAGLHAAAHPLVLFLDDDLLASPQLLGEHAKAHAKGGDLLAFGPVMMSGASSDGVASRLAQRYYSEGVYGPLLRGEIPRWPTHARVPPNSSLPRSLLIRFGGFDETFVNAHEDVELGIRLWHAAIPFTFLPKAETHHLYTKSDKEFSGAESERSGKNEVMLCRKHPEYRPFSLMANVQRGRLFRNPGGEVLLRYRWLRWVASRTLSLATKSASMFGDHAREEHFFALRSNFVALGSTIRTAGSWEAFRSEFWMRLPVLMYHHVGSEKPGMYSGLSITPEQFQREMQRLSDRGYTPISSADWVAWCESGKALPTKPILITFDDAYRDLVIHALPVLRDHGFRAIVFVPTAYIGGSNVWDQAQGRPELQLMSKEEIVEWTSHGIEFGAHSHTHPELDCISADAVHGEVEGSRQVLEELCRSPVVAFAYPYGSYNAEVRNIVARSFRLAVTTEEGMNTLGIDLLQLRRTMVQPHDRLLDFSSRLRFGMSIPLWIEINLRRAARKVVPRR